MTEEEIWKRYETSSYEASNLGNVRNRYIPEHNLKPWTDKKGYLVVRINFDGKENWFVHRLVLYVFLGPSPLHTNHKDGDIKNNRLDNLEYVTAAQNNIHAIRTGLKVPWRKLTDEQVLEIKASKEGRTALSRRYHVGSTTIYRIQHGELDYCK